MSAGDSISIDTGSGVETRKIVSVGTAAGNSTTVWQPLPESPVITIPVGSDNLPVTSVSGFMPARKSLSVTAPPIRGSERSPSSMRWPPSRQ